MHVRPTGPTFVGPHWVRAATVEYGRQRSSAVTDGSKEPQVVGPTAHAAEMMQVGNSDCGPEGPGWMRRAADGQQPVFVTTGAPARKP
jgi:hypothetical protein